jgi:hypothetical protein
MGQNSYQNSPQEAASSLGPKSGIARGCKQTRPTDRRGPQKAAIQETPGVVPCHVRARQFTLYIGGLKGATVLLGRHASARVPDIHAPLCAACCLPPGAARVARGNAWPRWRGSSRCAGGSGAPAGMSSSSGCAATQTRWMGRRRRSGLTAPRKVDFWTPCGSANQKPN